MNDGSTGADVFARRTAGILLHPTSLPGTGDCGTLGRDARRFVQFIADAGFAIWQTLPLGPVDSFGSPYSLSSAYAGDLRLIDTDFLDESAALPDGLPGSQLFASPAELFAAFAASASDAQTAMFVEFVKAEREWLLPYSLFELFSSQFAGQAWWQWPEQFAKCDRAWLAHTYPEDDPALRALAFRQYLFSLQWRELKAFANERGIRVFGDMPFYVDRNSADVWWDRQAFLLDERGSPTEVAGVPPDYFSDDGQLWGNPLFDWDAMRADGFSWWRRRLQFQLRRFDLLRIDHFRALESFWAVPAHATSAKEGRWVPGAGNDLLTALREDGDLPLVAEDLGIITDAVRELRDEFSLPGMAVLQFGFDGSPDNPHLPDNLSQRSVFYTGTHDNDTLRGWFEALPGEVRQQVAQRLSIGSELDFAQLPNDLLRVACESRANLVVIPLQDLLNLDSNARMNTPGVAAGNWSWRFDWRQVPADCHSLTRTLLQQTHRLR